MKTKVSLQAIKGSLLKDHYYLTDDDQCFTFDFRELILQKTNRVAAHGSAGGGSA
jgi:hypothetical protein